MAHILLIDDDPVILTTVRAALVQAAHTVIAAKDGYEALEQADREVFQLIITDANMPGGISGFQVVTNLRKIERYKAVPVIFITGRREKKDVIRALDSGADEYLIKPIDLDLLLAKVTLRLQTGRGDTGASHSAPVSFPAVWKVPIQVDSVTDQGLILLSGYKIAVQSELLIESAVFAEIGIETPKLIVTGCSEKPGDERQYTVHTQFLKLEPASIKKIQQWIQTAAKKQFE